MLSRANSWHAGVGQAASRARGRSCPVFLAAGYILAFIVWQVLASAPAQALTAEELNLIAEGFDIFNNETFDGNGRSCGTCHIGEKNYNITPADIAQLSPAKRALVFATNSPELENPTLVEKLALFNINEEHEPGNIDEPEGPFRASMTISLPFTTANDFCSVPAGPLVALTQCVQQAANEPVNDGTRRVGLGWSGDGGAGLDPAIFPPGPDSQDCIDAITDFQTDPTNLTRALRAFSLGAVRTHNPLSLDRIPGVDFRCPTPHELDALAAFQQWLHRQIELDLTELTFVKDPKEKGTGPGVAEEGKAIFMSDIATCNRCHVNGGANGSLGRVLEPDFRTDNPNPPQPDPTVPGAAKNSHTGPDILRIREVVLNDLVEPVIIPRDAGDKQLRGAVQADGLRSGGFGIQSLPEAVFRDRLFHNNGFVDSVEGAAAFYFTPTFDASQGGAGRAGPMRRCAAEPTNPACDNAAGGPALVALPGDQALAALGGPEALNKLGFFLRALSAVYRIADCERLIDEMIDRTDLALPTDLPLLHCQFALNDVKKALRGAKVSPRPYNKVAQDMTNLGIKLTSADRSKNRQEKKARLQEIIAKLQAVRHSIATTPELP